MIVRLCAMALAAVSLAGCASSYSGSDYYPDEAYYDGRTIRTTAAVSALATTMTISIALSSVKVRELRSGARHLL